MRMVPGPQEEQEEEELEEEEEGQEGPDSQREEEQVEKAQPRSERSTRRPKEHQRPHAADAPRHTSAPLAHPHLLHFNNEKSIVNPRLVYRGGHAPHYGRRV